MLSAVQRGSTLTATYWPSAYAPWFCENRICCSNWAASSITCRPLCTCGWASLILFLSIMVHLFCCDFCLVLIFGPFLIIFLPFHPLPALEFSQRFGGMERTNPDNGGVLRQATSGIRVRGGAV